jgi:hypothetical protein
MNFRNGKIAHEHIYWDQASLLVQVGLLDPKLLPVTGQEQAKRDLLRYHSKLIIIQVAQDNEKHVKVWYAAKTGHSMDSPLTALCNNRKKVNLVEDEIRKMLFFII